MKKEKSNSFFSCISAFAVLVVVYFGISLTGMAEVCYETFDGPLCSSTLSTAFCNPAVGIYTLCNDVLTSDDVTFTNIRLATLGGFKNFRKINNGKITFDKFRCIPINSTYPTQFTQCAYQGPTSRTCVGKEATGDSCLTN